MPLVREENQGDKITVDVGGLIDIADEHGLKIAGVEITAVNSGAALLEGVTGGTVTASKAVVVDANKAVDTMVIASLKLGAGAGTAVTATAAEINKLAGNAVTAADLTKLHATAAVIPSAAAAHVHIIDPAGGATVDAEARTAINAILVALEAFGINLSS